MIRYLLLFCLVIEGAGAFSQSPAKAYGDLITPADLRENLTILSSDALEGRATGTRGQKMAAAFISHHFRELGLTPPVNGSFYQPFDLYRTVPGETYLSTAGARYENFKDIVYYGKDDSGGEVSLPVVFAGRGRTEDYQQLDDIQGKGVMIIIGEEDDYRGPISLARSKKAKMIFLMNTRSQSQFREYANNFETFLTDGRLSLNKPEISNTSSGMFFVAPGVAEKIFGTTLDKLTAAAENKASSRKKMGEGKVTFKTSVEYQTVASENVLGYMEGSDKRDELLVVTSHYDHIGKKSSGDGDLINNGADDDGSGTVAVMQLAKVFAQAKKEGKGPRRSILFMTVAGEENGLLGSEFYTENPVFPLANTVVNLNIDMIGRRDEQHRESPPYVYVIGADKLSSELNRISETVNNQNTKLVFDYTYNDENHPARLYYRSDHWNFARKNIPIIFYFDGIHEDYHQPSDEIDKIEFDLLAIRTKCVFLTAWEIANRESRILPDVK